ncbi:hypothetical protein AVW09_03100 [Microbacterium sp. T32]|nr:hypothetical protein AVW09_03100 [Microbacterium sp. T32]
MYLFRFRDLGAKIGRQIVQSLCFQLIGDERGQLWRVLQCAIDGTSHLCLSGTVSGDRTVVDPETVGEAIQRPRLGVSQPRAQPGVTGRVRVASGGSGIVRDVGQALHQGEGSRVGHGDDGPLHGWAQVPLQMPIQRIARNAELLR